jgi:hypothetical protein
MAGTAHLPLWRRQAQTRAGCAAFPPLAVRSLEGGKSWRDRYHALPRAAQQQIINKMVLGTLRYRAKKHGWPLPVVFSFDPEQLPDGSAQAKPGTLRQMTDDEIRAILPDW